MFALPVVAVLGVTAPLLVGSPNFSILGLYFAVPMVVAPAVVRWVGSGKRNDRAIPFAVDWRVWSIMFHATVGALVYLLVVTPVRTYAFYGGVSFIYLLCFLLITTSKSGRLGRALNLYHLSIAVLLVIYSVTLTYDFFIGHGDLTTHISITTTIIETEQTSLAVPEYEPFQLWHIYAAISSQLFGDWVAPHTTMYLLSGAIFATGIGLMYGIARRIYPDERVGLISCLVMISFPLYLFYGMYSIPRSVTSVLFLAFLLTVVDRPSARLRALSVIFIVAIVVYHPVSIPFILAILGILTIAEHTIDAPVRIMDAYTFSAAILITSIYWLYNAEFIVTRIVGTIVARFVESSGGSSTPSSVFTSPWVEVANFVPYAFILLFVLLGFLFWQRRLANGEAPTEASDWTSRYTVTFTSIGILTVLLVPLAFPGPTLLLDSLAGINIGRFGHYTYMFFALTGGYGLYEVVRRGGIPLFLVLMVVLTCFTFTAVSNEYTAADNPVVERPFYTFYLTDQERQSFQSIDNDYRGEIGTDRITCRYMLWLLDSSCSVVTVEEGNQMFNESRGIVIREGELQDRPLQFSRYVSAEELPRHELRERNRVYDSGSVTFHT